MWQSLLSWRGLIAADRLGDFAGPKGPYGLALRLIPLGGFATEVALQSGRDANNRFSELGVIGDLYPGAKREALARLAAEPGVEKRDFSGGLGPVRRKVDHIVAVRSFANQARDETIEVPMRVSREALVDLARYNEVVDRQTYSDACRDASFELAVKPLPREYT